MERDSERFVMLRVAVPGHHSSYWLPAFRRQVSSVPFDRRGELACACGWPKARRVVDPGHQDYFRAVLKCVRYQRNRIWQQKCNKGG